MDIKISLIRHLAHEFQSFILRDLIKDKIIEINTYIENKEKDYKQKKKHVNQTCKKIVRGKLHESINCNIDILPKRTKCNLKIDLPKCRELIKEIDDTEYIFRAEVLIKRKSQKEIKRLLDTNGSEDIIDKHKEILKNQLRYDISDLCKNHKCIIGNKHKDGYKEIKEYTINRLEEEILGINTTKDLYTFISKYKSDFDIDEWVRKKLVSENLYKIIKE